MTLIDTDKEESSLTETAIGNHRVFTAEEHDLIIRIIDNIGSDDNKLSSLFQSICAKVESGETLTDNESTCLYNAAVCYCYAFPILKLDILKGILRKTSPHSMFCDPQLESIQLQLVKHPINRRHYGITPQ